MFKKEKSKGIAECLRRPYAEISCRDMTAVDMGGVSRIYEGGRHGKFQETLTTYGTDACILLDEFDKMIINEKDCKLYFMNADMYMTGCALIYITR